MAMFCYSYKKFFLSALFLALVFSFMPSASVAFVGTIKNAYELGAPIIKMLATMGKAKGSSSVAIELASLAKNVPASQMKYFYEMNYLKILVQQNRITPRQMEEYYKNLKDVKGFRNTLSKMVGKDTSIYGNANAKGHGFELEMANTLAKSRFKVLSLGDRFKDGLKHAETDVDVLAEKGGKLFAFELKNYSKTNFKLDERSGFYDDIKSMAEYAKQNSNVQPVFLMKNVPDRDTINHLTAIGKANNVMVGFGDPSAFIKAFLR